jgi:hypothetical protein
LVNLATVPDSGDSDGAGAVVHGIDDAVIAEADAKVRPMACQRQETRRPRISVPNLWRSRSVPRWLAVLFPDRAGSCPAGAVRGPVLVVFMLPCVVAMVVLAARIWRAAAGPAR